MDPEEETFSLTPDDIEIAWEVNALLTALHEGAQSLYEKILDETANPAGLLVMTVATLKVMVDSLLELINESDLGVKINFGSLIRMTAESLTEMNSKKDL